MLDQFGDDFILPGQLFVELFNLVLQFILPAVLFWRKSCRAVFKEGLLPLVKLRRGNAVLLAHFGERPLLKKMFPNDFYLFYRVKPPALLLHTKFLSKMFIKE